MNIQTLISNKRILLALGMIVAVTAIVIASTGAFFSDTETSAGNIFTAGSIDLTVDHTLQTYNGVNCTTCNVSVVSDETNIVVEKNDVPVATTNAEEVTPTWVTDQYWTASSSPELAGSEWIWATDPVTEDDVNNTVTYTFRKEFTWMGPVVDADITFGVAADNSYVVRLNGTVVATGVTDDNFSSVDIVTSIADDIDQGVNVLEFEVTNKAQPGNAVNNPGGLRYVLTIDGNCEDDFFQSQCQLWSAKNLEGEKFFNFEDVKPGDYGTDVISLHVTSNDAYACLMAHDVVEADNTTTEPEDPDDADNLASGELGDILRFAAWNDADQDGVHDSGEEILLPVGTPFTSQVLADLSLITGQTAYVGLAWCAGTQTGPANDADTTPFGCDGSDVDNASQTDSLSMSLTAYAVQQRNNIDFNCSLGLLDEEGEQPEIQVETSSVLNFGSTGWGGWSCPAGTTAVDGRVLGADEYIAAEGLAIPGAIIGGSTYPVFPHYTFGAGETGYVMQNGPVGQSVQIEIDCQVDAD